jgi:glycosyltransferase involved in cell wall biosynthesis
VQNGVTRRVREQTVSVVIPAKNEARNLEIVLLKLPTVHEVILVDGHSVDDMVDTARRVMEASRPRCRARQRGPP